jgi:hypothetical protein
MRYTPGLGNPWSPKTVTIPLVLPITNGPDRNAFPRYGMRRSAVLMRETDAENPFGCFFRVFVVLFPE